jgi:predicted GNAT family acetyltransferase
MVVRENPARSRYELDLDGEIAFANYRRAGDVVSILHTEVPVHLRNRGAGAALVRGVLDAIRAEGRKVEPVCPFVKAYIERHPADRDLVA